MLSTLAAIWKSTAACAVSRAKIAASLATKSGKANSRLGAESQVSKRLRLGWPAAAASRWATSRATTACCQFEAASLRGQAGAGAGPEEEEEGPPVEESAAHFPEPLRAG